MIEINIIVVESPKKARRFKENYLKFVEKNPEWKKKYAFISTGGSLNKVDFPKADKTKDVNFNSDEIQININPQKKTNLDRQLTEVLNNTAKVRDWWSSKNINNFIIASDPDREGAGIAKGVTSYINDLKMIRKVTIPQETKHIKYMDVESYSFEDLHNRIQNGDLKKTYDVDLGNQQVMRSAIDKFLGFSSLGWTSNKINFSTGRIKRPLLQLIKDGEEREKRNKETDVIEVTYKTKIATDEKFDRYFVLKDKIKKEILETQPLLVKYEDLEKNHSYIPNLAELLILASQRNNMSLKEVYDSVEKLYLGVRLKFTDGNNKEVDDIQPLTNYPRTDSKIIENPVKKIKQQQSFIKEHLRSTKDKLLTQDYEEMTPRKFKNVNDEKKYPYIQKGHEALLPNFLSISGLFLSNVIYSDGSKETKDDRSNISLTYKSLRDQVFCTLFETPKTKELKIYYIDENGREINLPLLVRETTTNKDFLSIDSLIDKKPSTLTSELSLFKQMLRHNLARPSTYHQITNNLDSFQQGKFGNEPLVTASENNEKELKVTNQGLKLLEETKDNPYFNIKYTKEMEKKLSSLKGIKSDKELKKEIAKELSEINNTVNKTLPKEVKENKGYTSHMRNPSKNLGY